MITLEATRSLRGRADTAGAISYTIFGDEVTASGDSFKVLNQNQMVTTNGVLYTAPASTQTLIKEIHLANTTGSNVVVWFFAFDAATNTNRITGTMTIPANGTGLYNDQGWNIYDSNGIKQYVGGTGPAGTNTIGTTTTGNPGTSANVTNTGTPSAGIWNFTIPAGAVWRDGSGVPSDGTGVNGDYYVRTGGTPGAGKGDVYLRSGGTYSVVGNILGPTGSTGSPGVVQTVTATNGTLVAGGTAADPSLKRAAVTGDVSIPDGSNTAEIQADAVGNTELANMAQATIKGRAAGAGTGDPADLTSTEATAVLNTATTALKGLQSAADKLKQNNAWIDIVADHGADPTGAADASAAIQAAITAAPAAGGVIFIPAGTYSVSTTISVNKPIIFKGASRAVSNIRTTHATNDVFDITTGAQGAGFEDMRITATNSTLRTSGYGIDMNTLGDVYVKACDILYMHTGIRSNGALQFVDDANIRECGLGANNGANILVEGFGDRFLNRLVIDNGTDPVGHAGIRVRRCSSLLIADSNIVNATNCLDVVPNGGAGQEAASVYAVNTFFDSSVIGANIVPATNNDTAQRLTFVRCWFGTHSTAGVVLGSASINVANTNSVDFIACEFYQNGVGIDSYGVAEWSVRASRFAGNTTAGIRTAAGLQAGIHKFTISDNVIGNVAGFGVNGVAINVQSGTYGRYQITDNRGLETNTTGGIIDAGTVGATTPKIVKDNLGLVVERPALTATPATFGAVETVVHQVPLPAAGLLVGTTIRITAHGIITATTPTLLGRLRIGAAGTTGDTQVCATAATAVATGTGWSTDFYVTIRSIGSGGTALGNGVILGTAPGKTAQTAAVTVNTTVANFLSFTLIGGGTTPVVTVVNAFSEVIQQ